MYAYLKGTLAAAHSTFVIIDVQGVGYLVHIPCRLMGGLPSLGDPIQLFTTFIVRELSHALYGFLRSQERDVFEVLINVTGIGPKLALSLIGHLSMEELQVSVSQQDVSTLCRVPGVGKKTAERLIVELKDKLPTLLQINISDPGLKNMAVPIRSQQVQDAISALIQLGYHQSAAQKAIKQTLKELPETTDVAALITTALRHIS